ncbi:hypothetical protein PG987_005150 [Apiospora arundinis]
MTIVTLVNTVLKTTKVVTSWPPGHATNEAGTKVHTLTYTRSGKPHTTVIAYPARFVVWPESYTWSGPLPGTGSSTGSTCITTSAPASVVPILSEPQHTTEAAKTDPLDPKGLSYTLLSNETPLQSLLEDKSLFPDQQPIQQCTYYPIGQWNPFAVVAWTTLSSTSFEGGEGPETSPPKQDLGRESHGSTANDVGSDATTTTQVANLASGGQTVAPVPPPTRAGASGPSPTEQPKSNSEAKTETPATTASGTTAEPGKSAGTIPNPTQNPATIPNVMITEGQPITLLPDLSNTGVPIPHEPFTTTLPNSHIAVGREGQNGESLVVIDHSNTITVPTALSTPVIFTTLGETLTFSPLPRPAGGKAQNPALTIALSNGHTAVGSKGPNGESVVILDGSHTIAAPTGLSTPATLTTMGVILTFSPPSVEKGESKTNQPSTFTLPNGHVAAYGKDSKGDSVLVIDGSKSVRVPTAATPVTITTMGETLTFSPLSAPSGVTASVTAITMVLITHANQTTEGASRTSTAPHTSLVSQSKAGKSDTVETGATTGTAPTASGKSGGTRPEVNYACTETMIFLLICMVYHIVPISI